MSEFQSNADLQEFVRVCLRRRWPIIFSVIGTAAVGLLLTLSATKIYESQTKVWIEQPSAFTINTSVLGSLGAKTTQEGQIELMESAPYEDLTRALADIITYCENNPVPGARKIDLVHSRNNDALNRGFDALLRSPQLAALGIRVPDDADSVDKEEVILRAGELIERRSPFPKKLAEMEGMKALPLKNTDMVQISYRSPDRKRARALANSLTTIFIWKNQVDRKVEAQKTVAFIEGQLDGSVGKAGVRQLLRESELKLRDFKRVHKIVDLDAETKLKVEQLAKIQDLRIAAEAAGTDAQAKLGSIQAQLKGLDSTVVLPTLQENPAIRVIQGQIVDAETNLLALKSQFTDSHPKTIAAQAKLKGLEDALKKQALTVQSKTRSANPVYEELGKNGAVASAEILGNEAKLKAIRAEEARAMPDLTKLPDEQLQFARLYRTVQVLEKQVLYLEDRLQEAKITEAMKIGNAKLVEMAIKSAKKVYPRQTFNLLVSIFLGFVLGAIIASIMEHLDNTLKTPEEISKVVGVPVLGLIPNMEGSISPLIMQHDGRSPVSEAYRTLRSNIKFTSLEHPIRTLLVTSPGAGEGKSTTISNIAISMAMSGKRIILMDTDLRRPTIHKVFGLPNDAGLTNVLVGEMRAAEVIQQTEIEGLEVITSGPLPPNPAELLDSGRMRDLMETLQLRCDTVLLDSPPVVVVTDAAVLGSTLDGVIMVIESGRVPREVAARAKQLLDNGKAKVLGLVVNKVNIEQKGGYYHYYSRYYGEGDGRRRKKRTPTPRG